MKIYFCHLVKVGLETIKFNKKQCSKILKRIFELNKEINEEEIEMFIRKNNIKFGI